MNFVYYAAVGIGGLAIDFGFFYTCLAFGLPVITSQLIAALAGFIHNHLWHHFKVFKHNQQFKKTTCWSLSISLIAILLSGPLIIIINNIIPIIWFSKIITLCITTVILFIIRKKYIFTLTDKN